MAPATPALVPSRPFRRRGRAGAWPPPRRRTPRAGYHQPRFGTRNTGLTMTDVENWKPGQDTQAVATARLLGQDPDKIHCPAWGVVGNLGDSICYAGVPAKVEALQADLRRRVTAENLRVRFIAPNYAGGISDGQRNGTPEMRYSLIGRETTNDGVCLHLEGSDVRGGIAVVACDKPPVGTLAAILEQNAPAVIMSDG